MNPTSTTLVTLLLTVATLALAGCGSDDSGTTRASTNASFTGSFAGDGAELTLSQTDDRATGTIVAAGQQFPVDGRVDGSRFTGSFRHSGQDFGLTGTLDGDRLTLTTDDKTYQLARKKAANPLAGNTGNTNPANPLAGGTPTGSSSAGQNPAGDPNPADLIRGVTANVGSTGDSSGKPPSTASAMGPTKTFEHNTGFRFEHPQSWTVRDLGEALAVMPPDARTAGGQPAEAYVIFAVPTEGVTNLRASEVTQGAHELLRNFAPFASVQGSPQYRQVGQHSTAIFDAAGRSPAGTDTKVRLWATIMGEYAFGLCAITPSDAFTSRAGIAESMVATFRMAQPKVDQTLVGIWRNTETYMSGGFSAVTTTYLTLNADGTCRRGSKLNASNYDYDSGGNMTGSSTAESGGGDGAHGRWTSDGKTLRLMFGGVEEYEVYTEGQRGGRTLMLSQGKKRELWYEQ